MGFTIPHDPCPDYESPCKTSEPFCTTTTASSPASGKLHDCCNSCLGRCAITFGARRVQTSFVVRYLGHAKLTVLITNQMDRTPTPIIDRYARRMAIENVISDAIDFFRTDALSSAVPMRINVDTQPTVMASVLYRLLGVRVGEGYEIAEARRIYRDLGRQSEKITIRQDEFRVQMRARAKTGYLVAAGYLDLRQNIPWLDNKTLQVEFSKQH